LTPSFRFLPFTVFFSFLPVVREISPSCLYPANIYPAPVIALFPTSLHPFSAPSPFHWSPWIAVHFSSIFTSSWCCDSGFITRRASPGAPPRAPFFLRFFASPSLANGAGLVPPRENQTPTAGQLSAQISPLLGLADGIFLRSSPHGQALRNWSSILFLLCVWLLCGCVGLVVQVFGVSLLCFPLAELCWVSVFFWFSLLFLSLLGVPLWFVFPYCHASGFCFRIRVVHFFVSVPLFFLWVCAFPFSSLVSAGGCGVSSAFLLYVSSLWLFGVLFLCVPLVWCVCLVVWGGPSLCGVFCFGLRAVVRGVSLFVSCGVAFVMLFVCLFGGFVLVCFLLCFGCLRFGCCVGLSS